MIWQVIFLNQVRDEVLFLLNTYFMESYLFYDYNIIKIMVDL